MVDHDDPVVFKISGHFDTIDLGDMNDLDRRVESIGRGKLILIFLK